MGKKFLLMTFLVAIIGFCGTGLTAQNNNVAKVGNTEYATIDEAIAAWTNNTTLTLLANVTLSDVVTIKSTEHHILNLGTYTMTAASGKNAFVIQACGTGSAERSAITINADAANPGGINAGSKCVIYYKYADGGISTEDRPIIKINGGVFTGSTSSWGTAGIYTIGTAARKCATVNVAGGTFNCSIVGSGKSKLIVSGGLFNYTVSSQGDSTCSRLISGGTFKTLGFMTADSNNTKFWIGTSMGNSNVGAYIDDNGYLVVGGPVVTEPGTNFEASSPNHSNAGFGSYLTYSSVATNGIYYTSVEEALTDNNKTNGSVTVYVDELNMADFSSYKGTIVVPADSKLTITNAPATLVVKDEEGNVLEANANGSYTTIVPDYSGEGTETSPYIIASIDDLSKLRDKVNGGETYEGVYFKLTSDITLTGEWTPIGNGSRSSSTYTGNAFKGVFDGNEKTIDGLNIANGSSDETKGLFGVVDGGTVKNLKLTNVNISTSSKNVGGAAGLMVNNATIDKVEVYGTLTAPDGVGGIVGRMIIDGTISNCTNNATVTATTAAGGIVGKAYYSALNKTMNITGCTNKGNITGSYAAGGIAALSAANISNCSNTAVIASNEAGGIVGEQIMYGTINNNINSGLIKNINNDGFAHGGIIGWVRYHESTTNYPLNGIINVTNNTNTANIEATGAAGGSGGIVGHIYNQANVTGNTNKAEHIYGGAFAAGIAGSLQQATGNLDIENTTITVSNNISLTSIENITVAGLCKDLFAYNNDAANFVVKDNSANPPVAKIGETKYATLEAAFAAATEGQTITLLADATPTLTSQRAITKAAVIDLGDKTLTLTEDDLYFGTTTFQNGNIVVDPSVKPSTAVFWMFANQTLTFDNVKIVATGVTGTYLIGLDGNNSDLNIINGSEIIIENTTALDLDVICVNASTGNDIVVEDSKVNVTNLDGRVFFRGNYTVKDSEVNLDGITKAGFRIEAGQTLSIEGTSVVNITGEPRDGGIHLTDITSTYTKAETATVNATVNEPKVAKVGENTYRTFAEAAAAAQAGSEIILLANIEGDITVPANVTLNGNDFAINGAITADGTITFAGVTKAGNFSVNNVNTVVNIPAGASLQLTGSGRMVIGHGCTFNITGSIADNAAKTADKATLTPSLVMPGASFTGAGVTFNVTNAYISAPSSYCSSSKSASGTFDFNITNSIWDSAGKLAFEAQSTAAKVDFALVNSVLTTGSHLVFATASGEEGVVIDNSLVNQGTSRQIENRGTMTIKNGAVVNGAVATSSNAINPGTIIVENATYAVTGEFSGAAVGTGNLIIKKGANVSVGSIKAGANVTVDAEGMAAGDEINFTADLSQFTGTLSVINNDKLEAKIVDGKVVLDAKPVAKIGEQEYMTLEAAFAAATEGQTITMLVDATPVLTSQRAITKAAVIDLGGKTMTLTEDDLYFGTTTFKNGTIVVDPSVKPSTAVFWMFANQTLTFDNVKIVATGVTGTYLIGLDGNNSDLNLLNGSEILVENTTALDLDIICVNASTGNDIKVENSKVNVTNLDGRVFFRGNYTVENSEVNLAGITKAGFRIEAGQTLSIEGTSKVTIEGEPRDGGIHLTDATAKYTKEETATVNATVNRPAVAKIGDTPYYTFAEAAAAAQAGSEIILLADATVEGTLALPAGIKLTSNGHTINGSIRMLGDLELNGPLTITGGLWVGKTEGTLTATLSGGKLTANYFMFQRGTYTINADIDAVYGYLSFEGTFDVNSTIHTTGANGEVLYINGNVTLNDGAVLDSDNSVFVCNDNAVLTLKPGSKVDSNVKITESGAKLNIDATGMTAGASANITGTVTNSGNGTIAVVGNDKLEAKIVDGKIVLAAKPVAKIGETPYTTLEAAFKAATSGCTIDILSDVTVDSKWDCRYTGAKFTVPVTINGNDKTIKFTASVDDKNWNTVFRFEENATVNNLTVDISNATGAQRVISAKKSLAVDGLKIVGEAKYGVIYGEGASAADLAATEIVVKNSTLGGTRRALSDNEGGKDVKSVEITANTFNANVYVSAKETVTFTGNTVAGAYVNIKSYTAGNKLAVTATGNNLESNTNVAYNVIDAGGVVNAEGFNIVAKGNDFTGYTRGDAIWGEVWGNAKESFVIKVLDANGNVMGTTSLNNVNGIIDGDVNVTWSLKFDAASNTDEYWKMEWTTAPTIDNMPAKVELWVDGVKVSGGNVVLNGPDEIAKIYAAVTDASGKILGYHTDIQEAIKAAAAVTSVARTATAGTVEFLSDVTVDKWIMFAEKLTIGDGSLITLNINGVTIDGNGKNLTVKSIESAGNGNRLFYDAQNLTVKDLTINIADGLVGGIGLQSGTISNVTFNGGQYGVLPGKNGVTVSGCTFKDTKSYAVYYEDERPGIVVTDNTFNTADGAYAITMRSNEQFTNNTVEKGRVNLANSAKSTVSGNDFGNERFKVYNGATATISDNKINNLVFSETNVPTESTFTDNILSTEAQAAIDALPVMAGDGTEANPYTIGNLAQLKAFRDDVNAGNNYQGKYVALADDIDLNNEEWTPIGNNTNQFKGYFDGNEKTISNLKISGSNRYVGLFGYIKGQGMSASTTPSVKDLTLENVNVSGDYYVGGLSGQAYTCNITNVTVKGEVSGVRYVGGLVGHVYTYFKDCHFIGNASCSFDALGGIAGAGDCRAYDCSVIGNITGSNWVGGIVGNGQEGTSAVGCYVKGDVKTSEGYYRGVGGIAGVAGHGYSSSEFKNNYFDGEVYLEGEKVPAMIIGIVNANDNESIETTVEGNSWNTEHYDAETPVYVTAEVTNDDTTEEWIDGASEELTKPRNNNLVMLESDIQYVEATDINDVTIMKFSKVTEDKILPQIVENNQVAYIDSNADGAYTEGETKYTSLAEAYTAATDGQTITLLNNITLSEKFVIAKSITLDGNGKTLTYTGSDRAIDIYNASNDVENVTIKDLTVVATTANRGLNYNENGKFNVEGVTVTIGENVDGYAINFPGMADNAQVTIKNSKLTSRNPLNIWGENMVIDVYDSEIISVDNSTTYDYAAIQLNNEIPTVGPNGAIANGTVVNVYGGTITALNDEDEPSNVVANATETGVVNISDETVVTGKVLDYVANIGGAYFGSLQAAVNAIEKQGYNSPIVIMKSFATSETATVKNGLNVTIDLNGKTITVTDNTTKNFEAIKNQGTLTIKDSSADKTGKITVTATTNSGWNRYSAVIANTVGGKLTVDGGTLEHLGGTDMAYGIDNLTNGKGTYAETVINGGYIKSTYRAIRQFLNGVEAQNILTVNGGTIEGANKSIWMQDPSAKANTGTLTVVEDATLKGDVYLSVTEGSTEWPVEVSIAAAALQGESTVMTNGNVPAGYELELSDDIYGVTYTVATIGDNRYETLQAAITAAGTAETTINVIANTTENITIAENDNITLTFSEGVTLNGYFAPFRGNLTIKGGTINNTNSGASAIEINSGKLNLENVNIASARHAVRIDGAVIATINGGEYKLTATSGTRHAVNVSGGAEVTIKAGTFVGPKGTTMDSGSAVCVQAGAKVTIEGGDFSNGKNATLGVTGTMIVTGGTFDQDPSAYLAQGYITKYNETTSRYEVFKGVAKIENEYFASIQDAIDAAENNDVITVISDFEMDITSGETNSSGHYVLTNVANKAVVIDLNGKKVTVDVTNLPEGCKDNMLMSVFCADTDGNLTLKDSSNGNGSVSVTGGESKTVYSLVIAYGGLVNIEGGNYSVDYMPEGRGMIYGNVSDHSGADGSNVSKGANISGGNFTLGNVGTLANGSPWILATAGSNTGKYIFVTGGTYNADILHQHWIFEVVAPTNKALKNNGNGTYTIVDAVAFVKHHEYDGYYSEIGYATLEEAFEIAETGDVVTLVTNVELENTITVNAGKDVVLDLNGKTISGVCNSGQGHMFMVQNTADLTVKDSSENEEGKIIYSRGTSNTGWVIDLEGDLILESGTIELTGDSWSIGYAVDVRPNSWGSEYTEATTFTMSGGKLVSSDAAVRVASSSADNHENVSANFIMNGGEIEAAWDGIFVQQSNAAYDILNVRINGGNIKSALSPLRLYGPAATSVLNNVENPITLNITGGTFDYTGNDNDLGNEKWLVRGVIMVSGGATFEQMLKYTDFEITGGTFEGDVNAYCAEGFAATNNDNGTWTVMPAQKQHLVAGWNWYSSYIDINGVQGLKKIENALGTNGIQILGHEGFTLYDSELGWYGPLVGTGLDVKKMYKIEVGEGGVDMRIAGNIVDFTNEKIEIKNGFNWISYPFNQPMNLNDALSGFTPADGDFIISHFNFAFYYDNQWQGSLESFTPGEGYIYERIDVDTELSYNVSNTRGAVKANVTTDGNKWMPNGRLYPNNMTMIAVVDGLANANYEVAAFVNDELRGSARPIYIESLDAYMLFLTIHGGDEVEEMSFRLYDIDNDTEYDLSDRINYSNNAHLGSVREPYVFSRGTTGIGEASMSNVNIYPNPTTTGTEINLEATCDKVEVFNALGVKVAEYQNVDTIDALKTAGIYVIRITNNGNVQNCRLVVK